MKLRLSLLVLGLILVTFVIVDSQAGAGTDPLVVDIMVSPGTVALNSQGTWVTVHAEIAYSAVVSAGVTLDGIPVTCTKSDNRGEFVAKFELNAVKAKLSPGTVTLTLFGVTTDGVPFSGSDSVMVKGGGKR